MENSLNIEGVWKGTGVVDEKVKYNEETTFRKIKPNIYHFFQKTWGDSGPLHSETGYLKLIPNQADSAQGKAEMYLSHPFGLAEVEEGTFKCEGGITVLELFVKQIARSSTAKPPFVKIVKREYTFAVSSDEKKTFKYKLYLESDAKSYREHLVAELSIS